MKILSAFLLLITVSVSTGQTVSDALKIRVIGNGYQDETVIRFVSGATPSYDGSYDAFKFFSSNPAVPSIYSIVNPGYELAVNAYPEFLRSYEMDLFLLSPTSGTYTIQLEEVGLFNSATAIYVKDLTTGQLYNYRQTPQFTMQLGADVSGSLPKLRVIFGRWPEVTHSPSTCFGTNDGVIRFSREGDFSYQVMVEGPGGVVCQKTVAESDSVLALSAGEYLVKFTTIYGATWQELVQITEPSPVTVEIESSGYEPNVNAATISFYPVSDASGYFWDFGDGTSTTDPQPTHTFTGPGQFVVTVVAESAAGCIGTDTLVVTLSGSPSGMAEGEKDAPWVTVNGGRVQFLSEGIPYQVYGYNGQLISAGVTRAGENFNSQALASGYYLLASPGKKTEKFIVVQ